MKNILRISLILIAAFTVLSLIALNAFAEDGDVSAESVLQSEDGSGNLLLTAVTATVMFIGVSFFGVLFVKSMAKDKKRH